MKFHGEKFFEVLGPTDKQIQKRILSLRSCGPHSFDSLEDEIGNYVQVAGGSVMCMVNITMLRQVAERSPATVFPIQSFQMERFWRSVEAS